MRYLVQVLFVEGFVKAEVEAPSESEASRFIIEEVKAQRAPVSAPPPEQRIVCMAWPIQDAEVQTEEQKTEIPPLPPPAPKIDPEDIY